MVEAKALTLVRQHLIHLLLNNHSLDSFLCRPRACALKLQCFLQHHSSVFCDLSLCSFRSQLGESLFQLFTDLFLCCPLCLALRCAPQPSQTGRVTSTDAHPGPHQRTNQSPSDLFECAEGTLMTHKCRLQRPGVQLHILHRCGTEDSILPSHRARHRRLSEYRHWCRPILRKNESCNTCARSVKKSQRVPVLSWNAGITHL